MFSEPMSPQNNCMCIHINKKEWILSCFVSIKVLNFAKGEQSACWPALTDWFLAQALPANCHQSPVKLSQLSQHKKPHLALLGTKLSQVEIILDRVRIKVQLQGEDACHSVMQCLLLLVLEKNFPDSQFPASQKDAEVGFLQERVWKRVRRKQRWQGSRAPQATHHRVQGCVTISLSW